MIAQTIVTRLADLGQTLTTVESCTGGMVAAAITDIAGSSSVFGYGFVTYANSAKKSLVGVKAETLTTYGAVSENCVIEMAEGGLIAANSDYAISISGIAGPSGGSVEKPEGLVWFALAHRDHPTLTEYHIFRPLGREAVRQAARDHALKMIWTQIA